MKKILHYIIILLLFTSTYSQAQSKKVSGVVRDSKGILSGATVQEKGASGNGVSTDVDGRFSITLRGNSGIIIVKSIGYKTREIELGERTVVEVSLIDDVTALEEIVVVGYGTQKKVTLTGSVSTVSGDIIRSNPSASLQNALVGQLPGFFSQQTSGQPGADGASFFIRGISSFAGGSSNQPLIIVDDIEFSYDQFSRLDPNEVESLSILKDASMTAVYGLKGANGVILVTTRRGKSGKPQLTVRSESSLQQPTKFPEYLDGYESALLHNQAAINDGIAAIFSEETLDALRTGSDSYRYPNVDWRKELFKEFSLQTRNNIDLSGGSDKARYFVSVGHLYQNGMLKNFGKNTDVNNSYYHSRYNYRSNLDLNINSDLSLRLDLFGNIGQVNNPNYSHPNGSDKTVFYEYSNYLSLSPYAYPVYNPNGSYGYINALFGGSYNLNNIVNRLTNSGYERTNQNNMNLNASATHKLDFVTKGLSAKGTVAYASQYGYERNITRTAGPSYIWSPEDDTYSSYPANTYRQQRYFLGYSGGSTIRTLNLQGSLNFDRTFNNRHHLYGLVLYNQSTVLRRGDISTNYVPANFRGYTSRVGYDFKNKYLLQLVAAYNGSDRFEASKRYDIFPAVSAGWNISEEPFFRNNVPFVNRLKIRGSYGIVGSDAGTNGVYVYRQTYTSAGGTSFGSTHNNYGGIVEGRLPNENVTWEKEKKTDIGVEAEFFKGKLSSLVEYFNNERYDILTTRGTVSQVFGQGLPLVNMGRVKNKGWEVELRYRNTIGKDFRYNLRGQYSVARNKILFRDEAAPRYPWLAQTGNNINAQLAYKWIGYYEDEEDVQSSPKFNENQKPGDLKYADLNNDGVINEFDRYYTTEAANIPPITFGFETGVNYKNFGVRVFFQGATDFVASAIAENVQFLLSNMLPVHQKSWTPEIGNSAQYPRLSLQMGTNEAKTNMSSFWLNSGDYLRLKTAEINYSVPQEFVKKLNVQNIRIYSTANNLLTWSKLYKRYSLDPEILSGGANLSYPPQRIINFGLSITF